MPDILTVEVEIDLTNLPRARRLSEEDFEYDSGPMTLSEAIVERAALILVEQLGKDETLRKIASEVSREVIQRHVISRLEKVLTEPVTISTGRYGDQIKTTTVTEAIDKEIKDQLMTKRDGYGGRATSVLNQVIADNVNARLTTDLNEAFLTARKAMIEAATEAGKKALAAAVGKALG